MIIDSLENFEKYVGLNPLYSRVLEFLKETDLNTLPEGKTFLDGEDFMDNWGFGEDNCGNETNLTSKGIVTKNEDVISFNGTDCHDVVGRYNVTINGKTYDTVCVVDGNYNQNILSEI